MFPEPGSKSPERPTAHRRSALSLVLAGVIAPAEDVDEYALRWHVFVWDLWFLLWGLALAVALARFRHRAR